MGILETVASVSSIARKIAELAEHEKSAELRNQIIELQSRLLELQSGLLNLQQENADLQAQKSQLEEALQPEGKVVFAESVYWIERDGRRDGPYCPNCYDVDCRFVRLNPGATKGTYSCTFHNASFRTGEYKQSTSAVAAGESLFSRSRGW